MCLEWPRRISRKDQFQREWELETEEEGIRRVFIRGLGIPKPVYLNANSHCQITVLTRGKAAGETGMRSWRDCEPLTRFKVLTSFRTPEGTSRRILFQYYSSRCRTQPSQILFKPNIRPSPPPPVCSSGYWLSGAPWHICHSSTPARRLSFRKRYTFVCRSFLYIIWNTRLAVANTVWLNCFTKYIRLIAFGDDVLLRGARKARSYFY